MAIAWRKVIHPGWRQTLGLALLVFGLAGAAFYYLELKTIGAAILQSAGSVKHPSPRSEPSTSFSPPSLGTASPSEAGRISLSTATQEELESLPGIGPVKARAILEYRQLHGFRTVEELEKVKGIGPKTLERLRPLIEL